jgi:hypothetical protein
MKKDEIFNTINRFNSIVLMIAGILAIIVLSYFGYEIYKDVTRERSAGNIVSTSNDDSIYENWSPNRIEEISGTPFVMLQLRSDQSYAESYYSKSLEATRNILFINTKTNKHKWLFDTNKYLIDEYKLLAKNEYQNDSNKVKAVLYSVIKEDTNNDNRLNSSDKSIIALSSPSCNFYKEIFNNVQRLIGSKLLEDEKILILYKKNEIVYSSIITIKDFSIISNNKLSITK